MSGEAVTADQMREIDRIMIEDLGISLERMMENAGRSLAHLAIERYHPGSAIVLAGPGGNGGGGLVAARHLANHGVAVTVCLSRPMDEMTDVPRSQAEILQLMGVEFAAAPRPADLVLDALIGYSLLGDPHGRAAELISWANSCGAPILALDAPSGIDSTTGEAGEPSIVADATLTLALAKTGLIGNPATGALFLADISVPAEAYRRVGAAPPRFEGSWVIALGPERPPTPANTDAGD